MVNVVRNTRSALGVSAAGVVALSLAAPVREAGAAELAEPVRSAKSGAWSAPETWEGGKVPAAGARVLVRPGHRVEYDVVGDAPLRSVHVGGTLAFAPDRDTQLNVALLMVRP